jgi:hypothetical protein
MVPMIFAYAAWQDWDGVFTFAYHGDDEHWDRDRIDGFFDQAAHPAKLAFIPAAAQIFLRDAVPLAAEQQTLVVPTARVPGIVAERSDYGFWHAAERGGRIGRPDMIARRAAVRLVDGDGPVRIETSGSRPAGPALAWHPADPEGALFTLDSPSAKTIVGFAGGRTLDLSGFIVEMEPTDRNFLSLTLTSMDGKPIDASTSLLLTALDKAENVGLDWNDGRTFAANSWRQGPTMVETVPAAITIPTTARTAAVHALDETGRRSKVVASTLDAGRLTFRIDPHDEAVWYEISAGR